MAPSRSCSTEYWPGAVGGVLAFNCLKRPDKGEVRPPSGPASLGAGGLARGSAGPAPGVAVATAGGAQLMYRPGVGACAPAWTANATRLTAAATPRSTRKRGAPSKGNLQ